MLGYLQKIIAKSFGCVEQQKQQRVDGAGIKTTAPVAGVSVSAGTCTPLIYLDLTSVISSPCFFRLYWWQWGTVWC